MESILAEHRPSCPLLVLAYEALLRQMPFLRKTLGPFMRAQDASFWTDGEARCQEIVHLCAGDVRAFQAAVSSWVDFSVEYLERQPRFLETGRYACTSFDQIQRDLYDNSERMEKYYLPALMFSFVFSSNYIGTFRFFRTEMLPRIDGAHEVCDVGCGHGVYLAQMLRRSNAATGRGLDISEASLTTTRSLLNYHGIPPTRYALQRADLRTTLPVESRTQDAATCFEVLEHLDDPRHALTEIRRILRPGASLCLSAAIRMESIDHLHVFADPEEVADLISDAGFTVVKDDCIPLTTQNVSDARERRRLVEDRRQSVGYVALAV